MVKPVVSAVDSYDAAPYDAAIVLGAMVLPDGEPSPALARRIAKGVELIRLGHARHLLMTGGAVRHALPEATVMRNHALAAGIAEERILVEDQAKNTIGNARFSLPLIRARGWRRLLLVTDASHIARSLYVFSRFGIRAAPVPVWPLGWPKAEWWLAWPREAAALPWTVARVERALRKGEGGGC